ncbi:MAG: DUF302 domain-containing protein [bacterium]
MKSIVRITPMIIFFFAATFLVAQEKADYYFSREVDYSFDETIELTKASLKEQGFGIITEIEMDKTLKEKLDQVKMERYTILGACNPRFAYQTLQIEENIGLFLPCKVLIKEVNKNKTEVVMVNPSVLMKMLGNKELEGIADEVTVRFRTALQNL